VRRSRTRRIRDFLDVISRDECCGKCRNAVIRDAFSSRTSSRRELMYCVRRSLCIDILLMPRSDILNDAIRQKNIRPTLVQRVATCRFPSVFDDY